MILMEQLRSFKLRPTHNTTHSASPPPPTPVAPPPPQPPPPPPHCPLFLHPRCGVIHLSRLRQRS
jgi:hypothetical protein